MPERDTEEPISILLLRELPLGSHAPVNLSEVGLLKNVDKNVLAVDGIRSALLLSTVHETSSNSISKTAHFLMYFDF